MCENYVILYQNCSQTDKSYKADFSKFLFNYFRLSIFICILRSLKFYIVHEIYFSLIGKKIKSDNNITPKLQTNNPLINKT